MSSPAIESSPVAPGFAALALAPAIQRVLADIGYEAPSPIQAAAIPPMLEGRDVLGQAQTGTGKTAAFALPILSRLEPAAGKPQALVLAPTRELAIQVADAFQSYAARLNNFQVLPIYGGTGYGPQLNRLRRGVHVVVGTPGRLIDHLRKGTLDLSELRFVVLDEADEMLRMGFAEDVHTILEKAPEKRQTALFSATMPKAIRRIAQQHLDHPAEIAIAGKTTTATPITQRYWKVNGIQKLEALTRILEAEPFDAMIVFARTKQATETLAEKLEERGFSAAAINGDIAQPQRERLIRQLRDGQLDILVATDVAARGLDVERISHVLNYDLPRDKESYVHRIGRTGRAGRKGQAIAFVTPRERGMLRSIERATRQPIESMSLPTVAMVNEHRIDRFIERVQETLSNNTDLGAFHQIIQRLESKQGISTTDIAATLAYMANGSKPLLLKASEPKSNAFRKNDKPTNKKASRRKSHKHQGEIGKETFRLAVGHVHGIKPGNVIGAIANEAGLDSQYIGRLSIHDHYSLIDLPEGIPAELMQHLRKVRVAGQKLRIQHADDSSNPPSPRHKPGKFRNKPRGKFAGKPGSKKRSQGKKVDGFRPPRRHK